MPWKDGKWINNGKHMQNAKASKYENAMIKMAEANSAMAEFLNNGKGSSKGSNKGKGKGKGSTPVGLSNNQHPKDGQWLCMNHVCHWAKARIPNPPSAKRCQNVKCCLPKSEAMNPPEGEKVKTNAAPSISLKAAKLAATVAATKQRSAAAAAKTSGDTKASNVTEQPQVHKDIPVKPSEKALDVQLVKEAVKEQEKQSRRPAFTLEQAQSFTAVAPALTTIFESLQRERFPSQWNQNKDPRMTASSFLKDSQHFAKGVELLEAEEEVQRLQTVQMTCPPNHRLHKAATEDLVVAQTALAKLAKDTPSLNLKTCCHTEVRAAYMRSAQTRKDRAAKGKEAAQTRREKRWETIRAVRTELDAFEDALLSIENELQTTHEGRQVEHDAFDEEVMTCLRERLEEWGEGAPIEEGATEHWVDIDKPADPALEGQRKLKEAAEEKLRNLQVEIEKARTEAAEAKAKLEEKEKVQADRTETTVRDLTQQQELQVARQETARWKAYGEAMGQFYRSVDGLADLTPLQKPSEENMPKMRPAMVTLHTCLNTWANAGGQYPFTLEDIPAVGEGRATPQEVLKDALGCHWPSFFPAGAQSPPSTVVPAQAARLVAAALTKLDETMSKALGAQADAGRNDRELAEKAMATALDNGKKRVLAVPGA